MSLPSEKNDESSPTKETEVRKCMIVTFVTFTKYFSFVTILLLLMQATQASEFSPEDRLVRYLFSFNFFH